jgi:hypothetical protein
VAVAVVDRLEVVAVEEQQRQREVTVAVPLDLVLEVAEEEAPVVDARELILEQEPRRVLPQVLKKVDELSVLQGGSFA